MEGYLPVPEYVSAVYTRRSGSTTQRSAGPVELVSVLSTFFFFCEEGGVEGCRKKEDLTEGD